MKQSEKGELQRRLRATLKHFDTILKPLQDVLRAHTQKVGENYGKGELYIGDLTTECNRTIENYTIQLMMFTIEFIFTEDDLRFHFKGQRAYKMLVILYLERLKQHFSKNKDREALKLIKRMEKMKQDKDNDSDEDEGFFGSEDDKEKNEPSSVFMKNMKYAELMKDPAFRSEQVIRALEEKDDQIKNLQVKLAQRERNLTDITAGYLKDLQNMREQMFRKSNNDDKDFYEVQYFDSSEIEDPKYRELVNNKMGDLKSQYEKKTRDLFGKIEAQKVEISNQKFQIQGLIQKTLNLDNPEYLLHKVFNLEKSPYRVWRMIQDARGNEYFFEVFEKQRPSFGINYREVNKLLMQSKAYDREYEYFRKGVEDQMCSYLDRAIQTINDSKQEINILLDEKDLLLKQIDKGIQENNEKIVELVGVQMKEWKIKQIQQYEGDLQYLKDKANDLDGLKLKYTLKLWAQFNQISKFKSSRQDLDQIRIKELITTLMNTNSNSKQQIKDQQSEIDRIQEQLYQVNVLYQQLTIKYAVSNQDNQTLRQKIEFFKQEKEELMKTIQGEKQQKKDIQAKCNNYERLYTSIVKHLDPRMLQAQIEIVNLDDEKRESTKTLKERIKTLTIQGKRFIKEVIEQKDKNLDGIVALSAILPNKDQTTLTYLFNLNQNLDEIYQKHQLDSEPSEIEKKKERFKDKGVQTTLYGEDLEYIEKSNQELLDKVITLEDQLTSLDNQKQQRRTPSEKKDNVPESPANNDGKQHKKKQILSDKQQLPSELGKSNKNDYQQKNTAVSGKKNFNLIISDQVVDNDQNQSNEEYISQSKAKLNKTQRSNTLEQEEQQMESKLPNINIGNHKYKYYSQSSEKDPLQKQSVFSRLFDDSKKKQKRIDHLKQQLQKLEEQQWSEMLQIMNHTNIQEGVSEFQEQLQQNKQFYSRQLQNYIKMQEKLNHQKFHVSLSSSDNDSQQDVRTPDSQKKISYLNKTRGNYFYIKRFKDQPKFNQKGSKQIVNLNLNFIIKKGPSEFFSHLNQENYILTQKNYIKNMIETHRIKNFINEKQENSQFSNILYCIQSVYKNKTNYRQSPMNVEHNKKSLSNYTVQPNYVFGDQSNFRFSFQTEQKS